MLGAYLTTLVWQVIWFGLLPPPWGPQQPWLVIIACIPLLIPLAGLLRGRYRSLIWGGVVILLYFTIAITEAWVNPPQRLPALVQISLAIVYLFAFRQRNKA